MRDSLEDVSSSDLCRIAQLGTQTGLTFDDGPVTPPLTGDEAFEDLTADSPARAPGSRRTSGWQPAS